MFDCGVVDCRCVGKTRTRSNMSTRTKCGKIRQRINIHGQHLLATKNRQKYEQNDKYNPPSYLMTYVVFIAHVRCMCAPANNTNQEIPLDENNCLK